mgnify:CR=1 FL=1
MEILETYLIPFIDKSNKKLTFQHDNDPKHKAKKTSNFIENNNIKVINWPSCSPDLNPIENLWKNIERKSTKKKSKK